MSTTVMPPEVFIMIAAEIPAYFALASFAATCRSLHDLLFPLLMRTIKNDTNFMVNDVITILRWASMRGYLRVVKGLLEAGAAVNAPGFLGYTALMSATEYGHENVVEQLIGYGADPNLAFNEGNACTIAVRSNQPRILRTLFRHGATVDRQHWWILLFAARARLVDVARLLLQNGVDPNYRETSQFRGQTALHLAVCNEHASMVKLLRDHGADADAVNNEGETAIHYLISKRAYLSPNEERCLMSCEEGNGGER